MYEVERPDCVQAASAPPGVAEARWHPPRVRRGRFSRSAHYTRWDPLVVPGVPVEARRSTSRGPTAIAARPPPSAHRSLRRGARPDPTAVCTRPSAPARRRDWCAVVRNSITWRRAVGSCWLSTSSMAAAYIRSEFGVLRVEFLHPLHVGDRDARVLRFPAEVRRPADAVLPHELGDRDPRVAVLQDADDLALRELGLAQATPSEGPPSPAFCGVPRITSGWCSLPAAGSCCGHS